jgi:hypothetical protein
MWTLLAEHEAGDIKTGPIHRYKQVAELVTQPNQENQLVAKILVNGGESYKVFQCVIHVIAS